MLKTPKSREGAFRLYDALIRSYRRNFGPDPFGMDWPTFYANAPELCARARELLKLAQTLPSRHAKQGRNAG